jgi:hypothetical protein
MPCHPRGTERTSCIRGSVHALSALDLVLTAAGGIRPAAPSTYDRGVVTERAKSIEELAERMRVATRPTDDDVTILLDGRRIDSREAALVWLAELEHTRSLDSVSHGPRV